MSVLRQRDGSGEVGLRTAAAATATAFFLSGAVFGTWVSRLPAVREQVAASVAELGMALLMPGVGSLLSMPFMGAACRRWGSRRMVASFGLFSIALLPGLAGARTVTELAVLLLLFGVGFGAWDVSMNVQGSAVERSARRAWMSRYHAGWSVGGITGAGLGALAAHNDLEPLWHFSVAGVMSALLLLAAVSCFIGDDVDEAHPAASSHQAVPSDQGMQQRNPLFGGRLLAIGAVTACATCIEGAAADWLAIYLHGERSVQEAGAAAGYMVFAAAMATGRLGGTPVIERFGRPATLRVAGSITALGVVVTVGSPWLIGAYGGAVLWGIGVAVIFPAAMSAAGEVPGRSSDAIAAVATIGYAGFLLGPPLIGVIGEALGLARGLLILLLLAAAVVVLAPALRAPPRPVVPGSAVR